MHNIFMQWATFSEVLSIQKCWAKRTQHFAFPDYVMRYLQICLVQKCNLSNPSEGYINTHNQKKLKVVETLHLPLKKKKQA